MFAPLIIIALVPFSVHVVAGVAILMNWNAISTQVDTPEYWLKTLTNTFAIFPSTSCNMQFYSAVTQISCAVLAMIAHFLGPVKLRRLGYLILLTLCTVIMTRHLITSDGQSLVGCFYVHIAFFVMLVFYQQQKEGTAHITKARLK